MIAKARKITVDGEVWQWKVTRLRGHNKPSHRCDDPHCDGSLSHRLTLHRVSDGLAIQKTFRVGDGPVTPKMLAEIIKTRAAEPGEE